MFCLFLIRNFPLILKILRFLNELCQCLLNGQLKMFPTFFKYFFLFLQEPRKYIQERSTQIYANCTLWEECKQTQRPYRNWRERTIALMWYYSPTKNDLIYQVSANDFWISGQYGKYNSNKFLFHPLGPFPSKMMRCPWILCFGLLPLQYTDLTQRWVLENFSISFFSLILILNISTSLPD